MVNSSQYDPRAASRVLLVDDDQAVLSGFGDGALGVRRVSTGSSAGTPQGPVAVAPELRARLRPVPARENIAVSGLAAAPQFSRGRADAAFGAYVAWMDGSVALVSAQEQGPSLQQVAGWQNLGCATGTPGMAVSDAALVLAGDDGLVRVYDRETMREVVRMPGHKGSVRAVSIGSSEDEVGDPVSLVVSAGRDATIRVWDVRSGSRFGEVGALHGHRSWVHSVCFASGSGSPKIASCSGDKSVRLWDLLRMREERKFEGHELRVWSVSMSQDCAVMCSGSSDATVRRWWAADGDDSDESESVLRHGTHGAVVNVNVSRDGRRVVAGTEDGDVKLWWLAGGEEGADLQTSVPPSAEEDDQRASGLTTGAERSSRQLVQRLRELGSRVDQLVTRMEGL